MYFNSITKHIAGILKGQFTPKLSHSSAHRYVDSSVDELHWDGLHLLPLEIQMLYELRTHHTRLW